MATEGEVLSRPFLGIVAAEPRIEIAQCARCGARLEVIAAGIVETLRT